jgi:hypothetical protein
MNRKGLANPVALIPSQYRGTMKRDNLNFILSITGVY